MVTNKYIAFIILLSSIVSAQEFNDGKCLTWRSVERYKYFVAKKSSHVTMREERQTSIFSPSKKFKIHYDTTGINEAGMYIGNYSTKPNSAHEYADTIAKIFDYVYKMEIQSYGFSEPVSDGIRGGGPEYDVYLKELGSGAYGFTDWDSDIKLNPGSPNPRYPAYIIMDNNFAGGYYTNGIEGAKVTAAHEFHHLIQVTTAGLWSDDINFYEMCATAMETTVFPNIRDYIAYIKSYFSNTSNWPLFENKDRSGYERAIFPKFLMEKFSTKIMNDIWKEMAVSNAAISLRNVCIANGTTIEKEFSEFAAWNVNTGWRADSTKSFRDGRLFPKLQMTDSLRISNSLVTRTKEIGNFTIAYYAALYLGDTTILAVSNVNLSDVIANAKSTYPFQLKISPVNFSGAELLGNVYASLSTNDINNWYFNQRGYSIYRPLYTFEVFPNPYNPGKSFVYFAAKNIFSSSVEINVYSTSMELIYRGSSPLKSFAGKNFAEWNGKKSNGETVSSGIYFFTVSDGENIYKGKFAVIQY